MDFFIKGIVLGFSIAAPVGPIGIHCIRKSLQFGRLSGLASGLGAATADLFYGVISAFGLTVISEVLLSGQVWIQLIGGIFLLYLGSKTFLHKSNLDSGVQVHKATFLKDFGTTFFLTLTNPLTILSFIAIFAGLGLAEEEGDPIFLVSGVFVGSVLWWLLLCEFIVLFRKKVEEKMMLWINRIAGILIFAFGVAALINSFIS